MKLIKSYEFTHEKNEEEYVYEFHKETYAMQFNHSNNLHLDIELMEDYEKKDFWYLLVKLSEKPELAGCHWGSIIDEKNGFYVSKEEAYIIYNNFSYIYRKLFAQRFYHVLNKESAIEALEIAKKLAEYGVNLIDNPSV